MGERLDKNRMLWKVTSLKATISLTTTTTTINLLENASWEVCISMYVGSNAGDYYCK